MKPRYQELLLKDLTGHPNGLAEHYRQFDVANRLLLTGHSHQAWPDVAFEGMRKAWDDAALLVDNKWEHAFQKADEVREGYSRLLDDDEGFIALGANTHELVIRFLSCLDLKRKPKLVITTGEFHTIRRQLARLEEEGIEIVRVPAYPVRDIAEKIIDKLDNRVSAVMVSSVFFETGLINPGIKAIAEKCRDMEIELLVDAYHSLNVAPFSVREMGLQKAFVTGAGYKYCQLGEGNGFMRFPEDFHGRPVITGWFSEFSLLTKKQTGRVEYGQGPDLFAGATYDPVSHYRAAEVFRFFREMEIEPAFLREVSQHQVGLLADLFRSFDLPPDLIRLDDDIPLSRRAGFLVLFTPHAAQIHKSLLKAGVYTDFRGMSLRLGPAPYLSDLQLKDAMGIMREVIRAQLI